MIAAIYARKSTEQNGVADEARSVTRQIEHAKAYAQKKGWTVDPQFIFMDDGISGAEFVRRPGFIRLMTSLKPKSPFQVLLMSEESRLGREQIQTAYALQQITDAGVRVFFYLTDQERKLETATDKMMAACANFGAEVEREKAQQRTFDAMKVKAKAGYVTGGRVFGYDNVEIFGPPDGQGRAKRLRVELHVNEQEAAVVRQIFRLYAAGHGFTTIAKTLNAEGAACPRPRPTSSKPTGWVSSSVRQIILRRLYVGEQVWGRTKKRLPSGVKRPRRQPEETWLTVPLPAHLRIISPELWGEVQARWQNVRQLYLRSTSGLLYGRPTNGQESPHLLTGFTQCRVCQGSLLVRSRSHGSRRMFHYVCGTHYERGPEICAENMLIPIDQLDRAVVEQIETDVMQPAVIAHALDLAVEELRALRDESGLQRERLQEDVAQVDAELARLTTAIATGGALEPLLAAVQDRHMQRTTLQAQLARFTDLPAVPFSTERIERELQAYLRDWPTLARQSPAQTRQILRKLLVDEQGRGRRIQVWREAGAHHFAGTAAVGRLFNGIVPFNSLTIPLGTPTLGEARLPPRMDRGRLVLRIRTCVRSDQT